jgi:hypothetical protein
MLAPEVKLEDDGPLGVELRLVTREIALYPEGSIYEERN